MDHPAFGSTSLRELSAPGRGGLSVLALEGPGALAAARLLAGRTELPLGQPVFARLELPASSAVARAAEARAAEALDEAIVLAWSESSVELHVHGSPPLVQRLRGIFGAARSARAVPPAFPACVEEEARALVPRAASAAGARTALDQARGALRSELGRLALLPPAGWRSGLERLERESAALRRSLTPIVVVLAGPANAGKSTLFNLLLGGERALVSEQAGTTRDPLGGRLELAGWPIDLVDTAGERALDARYGEPAPALAIERAATELARRERAGADLVLWLEPAVGGRARREDLVSRPPVALLSSKADQASPERRAALARPVSALGDPARAIAEVARALREALGLPDRAWSSGRAAVLDPGRARALAGLAELVACDARARALAELLGPAPA